MERVIIQNAIRTPDGTFLVSKHRHDFVSYKDKNGILKLKSLTALFYFYRNESD